MFSEETVHESQDLIEKIGMEAHHTGLSDLFFQFRHRDVIVIALNNRNGCEVPSRLLRGTIAIVGRHHRDCWQVLSGLLTGTIVLNNSSNAVQTYTILRSMSSGRGMFECVDLMRFHINQHILPSILPLFLKFLAVFKRMIKTHSYPECLLDGGAL